MFYPFLLYSSHTKRHKNQLELCFYFLFLSAFPFAVGFSLACTNYRERKQRKFIDHSHAPVIRASGSIEIAHWSIPQNVILFSPLQCNHKIYRLAVCCSSNAFNFMPFAVLRCTLLPRSTICTRKNWQRANINTRRI